MEFTFDAVRNCPKVVITGGVGVGKTTVINKLAKLLKEAGIPFEIIPEFLDASELGLKMLNDYLAHKISAVEFQSFIINHFKSFLSTMKLKGNELLIFERVPDDTVTCFSNLWNKQRLLSDDDLFKLYKESVELDIKFNLPSYFQSVNNKDNIHLLLNTNDTTKVAEQIFKEFSTISKSVIIGLYNSPSECLNRIYSRNRTSEVESYTIETVKEFNRHYINIYNMLMNGELLRFCDIGGLIK